MSSPPSEHGGRLARASARAIVRARWWVVLAWAAAVVGSLLLLPGLQGAGGTGGLKAIVPADTPAISAELREVQVFGFPLTGRVAVVQRDPGGLSIYDEARTAVAAAAVTKQRFPGMGRLRGALPISNALRLISGTRERDTTSVTYLLFDPDVSFSAQTRIARRYVQHFFGPRDSVVGVTGSVPARGEEGRIITAALPTSELLTLGALLLIVGLALRSVVAPLVALLSTGVAYVVTLHVAGALAGPIGLTVPDELEPVVVALLLGVVTDYAVFYLSALRRELSEGGSSTTAAERAATRYGPIVLVAGIAVAAGTAALLVAQSLFFRALGPAMVFTVLIGLLVSVTLVPALMTILGRWCFWPSALGRGQVSPLAPTRRRTAAVAWLTASRVRAGLVAAACVVALGTAALPALHLRLGISFVGSLPASSRVVEAADQARAGFAPGILSPTTVLVQGTRFDARPVALATLGALLEHESGVAGVVGPGETLPAVEDRVLISQDARTARYVVVLDDPALGAAAITTAERLQRDLPQMLERSGLGDATVAVAGDTAAGAYIVDQTSSDLARIAVAALLANLLMLVLFLRALVAAAYLLVGTSLSLAASLGLTQLLFAHLDPGAGLTFYVPFAAAVLLLAFGSDYNIFAVGNVWDAARRRPLRAAVVESLPRTVGTILVAGLALASSFGLLAVVPLTPFRQLAFMMFVGILLDVLVVRSLLLPSLLTLVGPASAWPSRRLRSRPVSTTPAATVQDS